MKSGGSSLSPSSSLAEEALTTPQAPPEVVLDASFFTLEATLSSSMVLEIVGDAFFSASALGGGAVVRVGWAVRLKMDWWVAMVGGVCWRSGLGARKGEPGSDAPRIRCA